MSGQEVVLLSDCEKCASLLRERLVLIISSFMNLCVVVFICVQNADYTLHLRHRSVQFFSASLQLCWIY